MNLATTLGLYGYGTHESVLKSWDTRGRGRHTALKEGAPSHVPDVVKKAPREWRRKAFKTNPKRAGGYFLPGTFTAKLYAELQEKPNEWLDLNELMQKHGAKSAHGALFAIRDVGKNTGKWTLEHHMNKVRLVPAKKEAPEQLKMFPGATSSPEIERVEKILSSGGVSSETKLGGGVNDTKIITLNDGSKAVFKYERGERGNKTPGYQGIREIAAWQIAKIVGMTDMVSPAVQRRIGDTVGPLIQWQDGKVANHCDTDSEMYDGKEDGERAAVFDYVMGNTDRHRGNWVISPQGKIRLIDHGYVLPESEFAHMGGNRFIQEYRQENVSPQLIAPYLKALPQIKDTLERLKLGQSAIDGLEARVGKLASKKTFGDMLNERRV